MKLAYLSDARSPTAVNWIRWLVERGHEVHWISSRPAAEPLPGLASFRVLPIFPELPPGIKVNKQNRLLHPTATLVRHWWMPLRIGARARELNRWIKELKPDLLHAMRIPQEGMVAAQAKLIPGAMKSTPLMVSVWGDDFTYHARSSPMMKEFTRTTMRKTDALHSDCRRDVRMAFDWGLRIDTLTLVEPGSGGVRAMVFSPGKPDQAFVKKYSLPKEACFIVNPRGLKGVARTDTFFRSMPLIRQAVPNAHFLALRMAGSGEALDWVRKVNAGDCTTLLPALQPEEMASLFRLSPIMLSLTTHDGLPNVLLESMACGSFPICSDLESIREWIEDGRNGFLVPPGDEEAVARAVIRAATDAKLRKAAVEYNRRMIAERADWQTVMCRVEEFYRALIT
jgi:glycosyltransferase involved in cell wall biosynthesis